MSELPYRQEHVSDSIANTDDLSNEELGALIRIERALWRAGGYLPLSKLHRLARAGRRRWKRLEPILLEKLTVIDGLCSSPSVLIMLGESRERRKAAAERAAAGALARWRKPARDKVTRESPNFAAKSLESNNVAMLEALPKHSSSNANQNQIYINSDSSNSDSLQALQGESAIYGTAINLLVRRVGLKTTAARLQVAKWVNAVGSEAEFSGIITPIIRTNLRGPNLVAMIDHGVAAVQRQKERGMSLPLPPTVAKAL